MSKPAVYEFYGEMYENSGEFLDTLAHEYRVGDRDAVISTIEDYGFDRGDIGA